ncbi:MAG: Ig-like domain-containing protein [Dehalococcoidia bacterium]
MFRGGQYAILVTLITIFGILGAVSCAKASEAPATVPAGNQPPVISSFTPDSSQTYPGGKVNFQSVVSDPNNDNINFQWTATGGSFVESGRANNTWTAPTSVGNYEIKLTVDDGKGGTAQETQTIAVSTNHPPVISSLKADPSSLQFSSGATLTCIASDPDGDPLQYKWEAKDGALSGNGNVVSWVSPSTKAADYSIFVTVSDGKGGNTRQELVIPVAPVSNIQTFSLVKQESGSVSSDGNRDNTVYKAGDDEKNIGYRAFFSYNILPLAGMDIKQATLKFVGTTIVGSDPFDPVTGVGGFQLRSFSYGSTLPQFNVEGGGQLERAETYLNQTLNTVDVTPEMVNAISNQLPRFQVEAGFMKHATNGNGKAQFIQWSDVVLEVTASPK